MCARGNTWAAMHRSVWLNSCQKQTLVKQKHLLHQENLQCHSKFFFYFRNCGDCSIHANLLSSSWAAFSFSILFFCGFQVTKKKLIAYTMLRSSENTLDWSLERWMCEMLKKITAIQLPCRVKKWADLILKRKSDSTFSWGAVGPEQLDVLNWSTLLLSAGPVINGQTHHGLHIWYCSLNGKKSVWLSVDQLKAIMSCWRRQT